MNRVVKVKHIGLAIAGEFPQAAQRHFNVARAKLDTVIEIFEIALVPDFHRFEILVLVLADTHAFRIIAVRAKGRRAARANPFIAAFMAFFLLLKPLFQLFHNFFPAAQRLNFGLFFFGEEFFGQGFQPFFRDFGHFAFGQIFQPFEDMAENLVEFVEIALILDQRGARQIIKIFDLRANHIIVQRFQQRQIFAQGNRHIGAFQLMEKIDEHGSALPRQP